MWTSDNPSLGSTVGHKHTRTVASLSFANIDGEKTLSMTYVTAEASNSSTAAAVECHDEISSFCLVKQLMVNVDTLWESGLC